MCSFLGVRRSASRALASCRSLQAARRGCWPQKRWSATKAWRATDASLYYRHTACENGHTAGSRTPRLFLQHREMISEDRKVSRKTRTDCSRLTLSAVVEPAGQRLSPGGVGARHLRRMFLPGLVSALSSWLLWNVSSSQARATGLRAAWVSPAPWTPSLTTPLP